MAHLETQVEFHHRCYVEQFLREAQSTFAHFPADSIDGFIRLSADKKIKRTKFNSAALEQYMKVMLDSDGFQLYYQPQYTASGGLRGMEALLRLPHPGLGFIGPDLFIPIAEKSGLINRLGLWVIRAACLQMKQWRDEFDAPRRIAVNVSPLQLSNFDFAREVLSILAECAADPAWLELEITERVAVNFDDVAGQVQTLSQAGIHFAADDFGTGYSSLQNLERLPISTVKIDRYFLERMSEPMGSAAVVGAIVAMGHSLGMQVIAEGVEQDHQRRVLIDLGCDAMQGYLLSPAVPADLVREIILQSVASTQHPSTN
jgi:EAL domain-containing protein (putative c-di-GMP-specific phosphodiesterase class I)